MLKTFIAISLLLLIFTARKALIPLAIGIVTAYILEPYVCWLTCKLSIRRIFCVFLAVLTVLTALLLLLFGFADIIAGKIASGSLSESLFSLQRYYTEYKGVFEDYLNLQIKMPDISKLIQRLGSGAIKFFVGIIICIYLLKDKDFFLKLMTRIFHLFLPQRIHGILREILFDIDRVISSFLRGVFVDSVIVAFLSSLALSCLKVDFAIFIGCFAGIANVIPYFGPILGIIPAVIAGFMSGGIYKAVLSALSLIIVQQIECNLIYPRIIGKSTGLHPLFVLIAVSTASYFGGLLWMVLAVPIAGILKVLLTKWAESI